MLIKIIDILGSLFGWFFFYVIPVRKRIVIQNLRQAYGGEKKPSEIQKIACQNYRHYGKLFFELIFFKKKKHYENHIKIENPEIIDAAFSKGKGVLLLSAHMGNFEIAIKSFFLMNQTLHSVVRQVKPKILEALITRFRAYPGLKLVPARHSYQTILSLLVQNKMVGFALDQHKGTRCVQVDFFGKRASTATGLAALALESGAAVIPVCLLRRADGGFTIQFEPPIPLTQTGNRDFDIFYNTQIFTKKIESWIRRHPEQWFWLHRRWKAFDPPEQPIAPVIPFHPEAYTAWLKSH